MSCVSDWDARFRAGDHAGSEPDPFLLRAKEWLSLLPSGATALDLACGAGRHAVWLAGQGLQVTAVDASTEALARTRRLAGLGGLSVSCRQLDLESESVELGGEAYDLVCGFYFLHRPLFPLLDRALRPGGLVIYKTYTVERLRSPGGPRNPRHLLEPNELLRLWSGFRVLVYEQIREGRAAAGIVARKTALEPACHSSGSVPERGVASLASTASTTRLAMAMACAASAALKNSAGMTSSSALG